MPSLEDIYRGIPQASYEQPISIPSRNVLNAFLRGVSTAYEQASLKPDDNSKLCPGFNNEEGQFQINQKTLLRSHNVGIHLLAANPDESEVFEGYVKIYDRLSIDPSFNSRNSINHTGSRKFGLTRASWSVLTDFLFEQAESQLFVPTKTKTVLPFTYLSSP
jgi:hypothetical protein